jgi:hypothetical protein
LTRLSPSSGNSPAIGKISQAGPAGQWLDRAMGQAGIDGTRVYVTNAVITAGG